MINKVEIETYGMCMQGSIAVQIDMDLYDKIIDVLKKQRKEFLIKIVQNTVEQSIMNIYIK
jgi:fructose-1-phosphate kinase PfkB-like protein